MNVSNAESTAARILRELTARQMTRRELAELMARIEPDPV